MEMQTTNGHTKTKNAVRKAARKPAVVQKAKSNVAKAEHSGEKLVAKAENAIVHSGAARWVTKNPKSAVGVALGAGLLVGALANGKYLRALSLGIAGVIGKRFF